MNKKRLSEKELLEGLTSHTGHSDELATTSEQDWGSYSEDVDKADSDFLVQRGDIFDSCLIEFEEDEQDRELIKQRENSPEIDVDIEDL
ncbi:hypothetical protein BCU45_003315 [Vibrio lentus]|uniref:hypothetical protein n=1 Tax=Vibrio lentus TaxID=136468 RepID=UPI000C85380C|nr:hypothetical protein [Vibrio lentus]PMI42461.1 hypothetical protein BCU45_18260 [Vibrio lentus]PMJ57833.1 hypothetical protein BCU20_16830 [Vibrio lentus]